MKMKSLSVGTLPAALGLTVPAAGKLSRIADFAGKGGNETLYPCAFEQF